MSEETTSDNEKLDLVVENTTLGELADRLAADPDGKPWFCLDAIRDPRTKRKLVDPRSVLTSSIVRRLFEHWNISSDRVIQVTQDLERFDAMQDEARGIPHYVSLFHHYLTQIFTSDKATYKSELQGLVTAAVELLDTLFAYDKIDEVRISPEELRPFTSYLDHLANTGVYWLATFAALNKKYESTSGSLEVWKSRDKAELRQLSGPYGELPKNLVTFYDIYGGDRSENPHKKGDLSLVTSGFFGAVFHDAALLHQPQMLISEGAKLAEPLVRHCDETNAMLKKKLSVLYDERPLTRSIIKNHHERLDGSGYPGRKKEVHLFAQILGVSDTYDEFSCRFVRGKIIRYMARAAGRQFDGDVVRAFLTILKPYSIGEHVDVYEGKGGQPVMTAEIISPGTQFRPVIVVHETHDGAFEHYRGKTLDLSAQENITFFV